MAPKKSELTPVNASSPKAKRSLSTNIIEQKEELENIIQDLEEENAYLVNEYTRLQNELNSTNQSIQSHNQKASHFSLRSTKSSTLQGRTNSNRLQQHLADTSAKYSHSSQAIPSTTTSMNANTSANSAQINSKYASLLASLDMGNAKESQTLAEARSLRQHEDRLEARMKILENHNRLLETQLKQLRGLQSNVIFPSNYCSIYFSKTYIFIHLAELFQVHEHLRSFIGWDWKRESNEHKWIGSTWPQVSR